MIESGVLRMPRQEVAEGQVHGYIGEDTGEVVVVDAPAPGSSNAIPDIETAQSRVDAAKLALTRAEADLAAAKSTPAKTADTAADKATAKSADKARAKTPDK